MTAEIIIKDQPIDLTDNGVGVYDPEQFGTGILVVDGTWTMHGAVKSQTFVRLSEEPLAGTTTLDFSKTAGGWKSGDRLILPDTRHISGSLSDAKYDPEWEEITVASVSGNGKTVTLTNPLQFDHPGARDANGQLDYLPHVGNLTRNITIRSENPEGTRGHTQVHHKAKIDIRYATFKDLGRTKNENIDNTTFDGSGKVDHIGTNQIARYPVHTHHLIGALPTPSNGYQYTLIGNAIDGGTNKHDLKWGMTIHGSHYGLIRENVVYNIAGAGIAFEDGSESYNMLEKNFVVRVYGSGGRADQGCGQGTKIDCGREGSGYWLRGPNNFVRDNVVANTPKRFGYTLYFKFMKDRVIPTYKGADPNHGGSQAQTMNMSAAPLLEFVGNETYGASKGGLVYWFLSTGLADEGPYNQPRTSIKDYVAWHVGQAVFGYPSRRLTFDRAVIRGDKNIAAKSSSVGFTFRDYLQKDFIIQNADIQGVQIGIHAPQLIEPRNTPEIGFVTFKDSFIRAYYGIIIYQPWHNGDPRVMNPREIHIRNVKFEDLNLSQTNSKKPPYHGIKMDPKTIKSNLPIATKVFVYDYNQNPGEDFQVYSPEQDPNYIMPQSTFQDSGKPKLIGSPVAGLTNTQNMAQYGIAMAGEITPCLDMTSYPEMRGFVCNGSSSSNPPPDTIPPAIIAGFTVQ